MLAALGGTRVVTEPVDLGCKWPCSYSEIYPRLWESPIFARKYSFWSDSYGLDLSSFPEGKIVVFGVPKSGNTWLQSLVSDALGIAPVDPVYDIGKQGVGMTHLPFHPSIANRPDFIHGACLVRDLRDVVASFYHYSQTRSFREARPEFVYDDPRSFYYDWFLSRCVSAFSIHNHAERYAEMGVPVIRYEELRESPVAELSRLFRRWGISVAEPAIVGAVEDNSIANLGRRGKQLEKFVSPDHFSRGGLVGQARESLGNSIVVDIERRFAPFFHRWGYA